jgi:hypothetical protein
VQLTKNSLRLRVGSEGSLSPTMMIFYGSRRADSLTPGSRIAIRDVIA